MDAKLVRVGRNESRFRDVNESIGRGRDRADDSGLIGFVCECGRLDCTRIIELTPAEYEAIRADSALFAICHGHDFPDTERVVDDSDRYAVVRKIGDAAELAETLDPRA